MSLSLDIDLMPMGVIVYRKTDDDFVIIDANKEAEKLADITKEEVLGRELKMLYPSAKESGFFDALSRVEKTGKTETLDTLFYRENHISGYRKNRIIKLPDGTIVAFFSDTNEKKKLESLLKEQRNIFQNFMHDSKAISVQGYDDNHEVIYWNRASEKLYGFSEEEAKGKKIEDLIIPDEMKEAVNQNIDDCMKSGINTPSSELVLKDKDGRDVFIYSQHKMIQIAVDKHEMYCIDIDLSATKLLEKELTKQRDFLQALFDVIPDLIWAKDIDGIYIACNKKFEQLFGKKESEIIGKSDFDFVDKKQANFFKKNDKIAMNDGAVSTIEEYLEFPDGSYKGYFEVNKMPARNSSGEITGIVGVARDISIRKEYEKELLHFANTDVLTGLVNRTVFLDRLEQISKHREVKERHGAVLFVDIDDFKDINDKEGHQIGDKVLIEVAKILKNTVRRGDTVARFGGDEFILILEHVKTRIDVSNIVKKALALLEKSKLIQEHELSVSVSVGISIFPTDSDKPNNLLRYADDAMYYAKNHGKNGYKFYDDMKE